MLRKRGFGLTDCLIVFFILGTIVALVLPRVMNLRSDAHKANNQGTAAQVKAGIKLLQSKASRQGYDKPLTIRQAGKDYVIIFTGDGYPQGIGLSKTNYKLFDPSDIGDEACNDFFNLIMFGKDTSVVTKTQFFHKGKRADYVAMGFKGKIFDGCRYIYADAKTPEGKVYTILFDPNTGEVTDGIGEMPR